jgi:hypothetical protein
LVVAVPTSAALAFGGDKQTISQEYEIGNPGDGASRSRKLRSDELTCVPP